jgi:2-hydroxycyclohexanecarboxyl-CoA dehydrogenase
MDMNLASRRVAVFGSAHGIGRAIAAAFAAEGCAVHGFDRDGGGGFQGDVTSYEQVRAFAAEIGEVDHVIYSVAAGSGKFGFPFWNLEPQDWARVLEVNLIGAVNVAHAFAPGMTKLGAGSMLFVVSVAGQVGSQTDPPYSAAKAGLINFVQCAAKDMAAYGIRVNALAPGMVKTGLNEAVWKASQARLPEAQRQDYAAWAEEKIRKVSPLGRWQTPEECAAVAVFLASEPARNITGQTINVDGGQVMHS